MPFERHALVERRTQPQHANRIADAQPLRSARSAGQRHVDDDARAILIDAHQRDTARIGFARDAAREADHVVDRIVAADFIDRGTVDLSIDGDRRRHGRDEDHVAGK
jgi:hypothetical protein